MDATWERLQNEFERLLALSATDREAELERIRDADPELAGQLAALVAAADGEVTLSAAVARAVGDLHAAHAADRSGETVGVFRLEEKIAAGGMGVVYRASRLTGFDQTVAVKFLSAVVQSADLLKRFEVERQILARLEHPYIARLIDGGTTPDGEPYLVMEYVRGVPLIDYCRDNRLDLSGRLRLFERIIEAVDFAHRALVIHRDLKPSNILVTDDGVPRLLDFGIASLTDAAGADSEPLTALTPQYASPEQLASGPVTTATDVYSLGVLLYQLLTDRLPHDPDPLTLETIRAAIASEPRPRPSALPHTPVPVDRELDALVGRALAANPDHRYATAYGLLRDIARYRRGEPLEAMPDTTLYRATKFVQRNRAAVVASAAGLLVAMLLTGVYVLNLNQARGAAEAEAHKANRVAAFMEQLFEDVDPGATQGSEITATALLEQGLERVERDFADLPDVEVRLRGVIGRTLRRLGAYQRALGVHLDAERRLADSGLDVPALKAQVLFDLGYAEFELGRLEASLSHHRRALALRRSLHAGDHPDLAASLRGTALLEQQNGDVDAASSLFDNALAMYTRLGDGYLSDQAATSMDLAGIAMARQDLSAALAMAVQSLDAQLALHGEDHPEVAIATNNIAVIHSRAGDREEALPWFKRSIAIRERIYGEDAPQTLYATRNYASTLWGIGRTAEAVSLFRRVHFRLLKITAGDEDVRAYFQVNDLIRMLLTLGAVEEAADLTRDALARADAMDGVSDYRRAATTENMALVLVGRGKWRASLSWFESARALYARDPENNAADIHRVDTLAAISDWYAAPGAGTLRRLEELTEAAVNWPTGSQTESGRFLAALADIHARLGEAEAAADYAARMLEVAGSIFAQRSIEHADLQLRAAGWYLTAGREQLVPKLLRQATVSLEAAREAADRDYPLFRRMAADIERFTAARAPEPEP